MKFGAMVVPRAGDWQLFAELEQMGYDSAWVPDSQMIYSDTYAVLALAAANTSRIRLGPGVADAQETAALRDFNVACVGCGVIMRSRLFRAYVSSGDQRTLAARGAISG